MTEALITKEMLRWARKRSFESLDDAAEKLNVKLEKLDAWENGDDYPTFRQAQDLAKKLRIPFGYLYLSEPPDENLPLPDLRTRSGARPRKPSPDFLEVLYDALRKQDWYHEYLANEQADRISFVGRFNSDSPVKTVAENIRRTLRLDETTRREAKDRDDFFSQLVKRTEVAGVLVMRSSVVGNNTQRHLDPDEFQGFAISDDLAPLIFINTNDFLSAQIFTLAHELAHIWLGLSGVSNLVYLERPHQQPNNFERVTDAIAAEILVPADTFALRWDKLADIDENLDVLSRHYRVSRFVILRRAYDLNNLGTEVYRSKFSELRTQTHSRKKGGGGNTYGAVFSRNSNTVTSTLVYSVMEGRVSPKEASRLLNIRIAKLRGLEQYLELRDKANA